MSSTKYLSLYVDDKREPPDPNEWVIVRSSFAACQVLATGAVRAMSLDYDLGDGDDAETILYWLEDAALRGLPIPTVMFTHSMNPVGRTRIEQTFATVTRLVREQEHQDYRVDSLEEPPLGEPEEYPFD